MKRIVSIILIILNINISAKDGLLDSSFGAGGRVTGMFAYTAQIDVAFQPDSKIVIAGGVVSLNDHFSLARYNSDGSLDSSFGTNGLVTTDFGGSDDRARAVVLQPDGKIVAVGRATISGSLDFALARYNFDGSLDSSFGTNGLVTTDFGGTDDRALAAVLQPDGKIITAGRTNVSSDDDFALARYNSDGSLDSSFGTGGLVTTQFSPNNDDLATAVLLQSDGKIVAGGFVNIIGIDADFALARYNSDGSLDSAFGTDGKVITDFGGTNERILGMLLQPDGKIVAVGRSNASGSLDFALARYNSDGSLDSSFGTNGLVTTDFGGGIDLASAVVLQPDGKIVAVGRATISGSLDFALARYNSDGSLDSSFGTGGLVTTNFGGSNDQGLSAVIQANGRIIAVGISNASGTNNFALARYLIPSVTISQLARDLRAKYFLLQ